MAIRIWKVSSSALFNTSRVSPGPPSRANAPKPAPSDPELCVPKHPRPFQNRPGASQSRFGSFPKLGIPFWGVPIIRTIVFGGLYWGPLFLGNYRFDPLSGPSPCRASQGLPKSINYASAASKPGFTRPLGLRQGFKR